MMECVLVISPSTDDTTDFHTLMEPQAPKQVFHNDTLYHTLHIHVNTPGGQFLVTKGQLLNSK